ncbi:MAG: VWA domain-containing protein, partial [Acidobacteriota bacterium]|nr:VWA domain-containing protein [Acidobacteriota bacterium]
LERLQLSLKQLGTIAVNEGRKPGRKQLIWIGPGWPMLESAANDYYSERDQRLYFRSIVDLSTWLREARMTLYSVQPADMNADTPRRDFVYQTYLKGVRSAREADTGNLALKVLVTQTGGLILGPDNDLAGQLNRCVADANAFYTISFDPPKAAYADEYQALKLTVNRPGLTVRTNASYYNQP